MVAGVAVPWQFAVNIDGMVQPQNTSPLKILLVDSVSSRAAALAKVLQAAGYADIHHVPGGLGLADDVAALLPDVIIVDMALPERDTLEGLRQTSARAPRPVILRTDESNASFIEEAISAGVSSYHMGSVSAEVIKPVVTAAIALFRRHLRVEQSAQAALGERRIIEKAKAMLIAQHGIAEPEAYRWLRSKAMKESRKLVQIAADVIGKTGDAG